MNLLQCLIILFAVTCSALGDDGVNEVKNFVKDIQIDNKIEELVSVDSNEMELLYLTRYKNSSETHLYITLSKLRVDINNGMNMERCPITLKAQVGMKILSSHVAIKALAGNRTILQWMEILVNPSALSDSSALLKHLQVDMSNCKIEQTEVAADADEYFFPAVRNGTNILVDGLTFEVLYPRKRYCGRRWCRIRFYSALSLKSPEKSLFAYQPNKTLIAGSSLHADQLRVLIDPEVTELWLLNETSGSLIKDSTLPKKNERVTFAIGGKRAVWCTQDRDKLKESLCTAFYVPGNNTGVNFAKVDHGDELLWMMPSTVTGWDGLILISLKRANEGRCNLIVTKQYSPTDGSHKSKVIYRDLGCASLPNFEAARNKLKLFQNGYMYCLSMLDHEHDIHFMVKCFDIGVLAKSK